MYSRPWQVLCHHVSYTYPAVNWEPFHICCEKRALTSAVIPWQYINDNSLSCVSEEGVDKEAAVKGESVGHFAWCPPHTFHPCPSQLLAPRERWLLRMPLSHKPDKPRVATLQQRPEVTEQLRSPPTSVPLTLSESCRSQHNTKRSDSHQRVNMTHSKRTPVYRRHTPRTHTHTELVTQADTLCDLTRDGESLCNTWFFSKV